MAGQILGEPLEQSYRDSPGGPLRRLRVWVTDPARWRDLAGLFLASTLGLVTSVLVISLLGGSVFYLIYPFLWWVTPDGIFDLPLGFITIDTFSETFLMWLGAGVLFALWRWVGGPLVRARARLDRAVFCRSRSEELQERVQVLTVTRAESSTTPRPSCAGSSATCTTARRPGWSSLSMSLGLAEELLEQRPRRGAELLAEARDSSGEALADLRDLVRGIHPPVLAERGLDGAVRALALTCRCPVRSTVDLPGRPPAPVESAAYFAVAEAWPTSAKHARRQHGLGST